MSAAITFVTFSSLVSTLCHQFVVRGEFEFCCCVGSVLRPLPIQNGGPRTPNGGNHSVNQSTIICATSHGPLSGALTFFQKCRPGLTEVNVGRALRSFATLSRIYKSY